MSKPKDNKSESDYDDDNWDLDDDKTANLNPANLSKIGGKAPVTVPVVNKAAPSTSKPEPASTKPAPATTKPGVASTQPANTTTKPAAVVNPPPQVANKQQLPATQKPVSQPQQQKPGSDPMGQGKTSDPPGKPVQQSKDAQKAPATLADKKEPKQAPVIDSKSPAQTVPKVQEVKPQTQQPSKLPTASPSQPQKQVPQASSAAQKQVPPQTAPVVDKKPTTQPQVEKTKADPKANDVKPKVDPKATDAKPQQQVAAQNTDKSKVDPKGPPAQDKQKKVPENQPVPAASAKAPVTQPLPNSKSPAQQPIPGQKAPSQQPPVSQPQQNVKAPVTQVQPNAKVPTQQPVTNPKAPVQQPPIDQNKKVDLKAPPVAKPNVTDKTQPVINQKVQSPATNDQKKPEPPVLQKAQIDPKAQAQTQAQKDPPKGSNLVTQDKSKDPKAPNVAQAPVVAANALDKSKKVDPPKQEQPKVQAQDPKKDQPQNVQKKDEKPTVPASQAQSKAPAQTPQAVNDKQYSSQPVGVKDQAGHSRAQSQSQSQQVTPMAKNIEKIDPNSSQPSMKSILSPTNNPSQKDDDKKMKDTSSKKEVRFEGQSPQKAPPGPGAPSPSKEETKQPAKPGEEVANKYSLSPSEQNARLKQWHQNMKAFKLFNDSKLPGPTYDDSKLFGISLSEMNPPFVMPQNSKFKDPKYLVDLQANCTLCDPYTGLYGRTVVCKSGEPVQPQNLKMQQWLLFMSDLKLNDTHLLCEIIINIYDKNELKIPESNIVIGVVPIRILQDKTLATIGKNQKIPVYITTPRMFVIFDEGQTIDSKIKKHSIKTSEKQYKVSVDVHEFKDKGQHIQDIKKFLQRNCIVGTSDLVPGFKGNNIPPILSDDCLKNIEFDVKSKVWAHKIKLDGLDQIEHVFQNYLKQSVKSTGYSTQVMSRKLTVTSSNSCFLMNQSQTSVNLKVTQDKDKKINKIEQPSEVLHIPNLAANTMTCLVFRVTYKVKYSVMTGGQKKELIREFVLGRHPFFMNFDQVGSGMIKDRLVSFNMTMCPELSIIKDLLFDANENTKQAVDLVIKLQMFMSNFEDLKTEEQQNKMQDDLQIKMLEMEKKKQLQKSGIDTDAVGGGGPMSDEIIKKLSETEAALRKTQIENQRLQKEMEKSKDRQNQNKMSQLNIDMDDNKVKTKPVDVPALNIPEADHSRQNSQFAESIKTPTNKMLQILIEREDNDVNQLTELLQRLLNQTKGNQDVYQDVIARLEGQIIRMLDQDPYSQMTMFGTTGRFKALQFNNLPDKDKRAILLESSRAAQDKSKAPTMAPEMLDITKYQIKPKIDLEINDILKASEISIKFVVFKTPQSMNRDIRMPKKVFFTTKFFTKRQSKTGLVFLRLAKSVAADFKKQQAKESQAAIDSNSNPEGQLLANQQYFLMRQKNVEDGKTKQKVVKSQLDIEYEAYKNDLEIKFDFDPSLDAENQKSEEAQHRIFCEYLNSRNLTVDIWDGDSMMHFGSCKIPLMLIMRQGQAIKTVGQEFDVVDPVYTQRVGGLQLVISNYGRQIQKGGKTPGKGIDTGYGYNEQSKTVVQSKPMEIAQIQTTLKEQVAHMNDTSIDVTDEDARKRERLQRIKKRQFAAGLNTVTAENRIQQEKDLWKVEEARKETKKKIFQELGATAKSNEIVIMQVISGEVQLQELTVKNPYDSSHTFDIKITDVDQIEGRTQSPEFTLIDGKEWKFWYDQGKCQEQDNWNFVDAKNGKMKLEGGKQARILFKFQSLREPIVEFGKQSKQEPAGVISHELRPRSIKIEIVYKEQAVQSQFFDIKPREMICDQVFRYYMPQLQPENPVFSMVKIPNVVMNQGPTDKDLIPLNQLNIVCSNNEFKLSKTESDGITYQVQCGKSMSVTTAFIYIYRDKEQSQLLGACKVEVHACVYMKCQNVQSGVKFDIDLKIVNPIQKDPSKMEMMKRTVELFSSNTQLVFAQNGKRSLHLLKESRSAVQSMPISVRTMMMDTNTARVTAVDINSNEILEQYLIEVQAGKPKVQDVKVINCPVGQEKPYFFDWTNPVATHKMVFSIASNNTDLIKPDKSQMEFNVGEKKDLRFFVSPQKTAGTYEATIIINTQQPDIGTNDATKPKEAVAKLPEHSESVLFKIVVK